jgi:N-methylhydantoinase A
MADEGERIVGVDVGGTFTDLILLDPGSEDDVRVAKVPTTIPNQAFGVLAAIAETGLPVADVDLIVHGTTTTTNALLERKIAKCGLITTMGFRDVLELGRRTRPTSYGMRGWFEPLIAREDRLEVVERMDADGNVLTPLDEESVRVAVRQLLDQGVESLVIHFLHSYINGSHERRAAEIAAELWPNSYITLGSAILSEYREYERGTTAAVNAAIRPVLDRYLSRLQGELGAQGYERDLLVMQGNGGTISAGVVAEAAVNTVMSGPASGVIAAAYTAAAAGYPNVITYDMGGTSSDVGLILGGVPKVHSELELEYAMPIHVPMVDVHAIGAGGGSLAYVNEAGLLQVGPESAGADPGPICYGRGGDRPTITDANLVLGRLNPERLLSVDAPVSVDSIRARIAETIGAPLALDGDVAAAAILRIANDKMAGAVRMVSMERGHDPRDFVLFAFGGAGPLHATALARELAIPKVLIPARPGITNAIGCVVADLRHDFVNTINKLLPELDIAQVHQILAQQIAEGREMIAREKVVTEELIFLHSADMQFLGQSHILSVPLPTIDVTVADLWEIFERAYWERFAVDLPEIRPVLVNLHTAVLGRRKPIDLTQLMTKGDASSLEAATIGTRQVWFSDGGVGGGAVAAPILKRDGLASGMRFAGPAIVEQMDTTTVIEPGDAVEVDAHGNLVVTLGAG